MKKLKKLKKLKKMYVSAFSDAEGRFLITVIQMNLGTSMPHWAHACWGWLHTANMTAETVTLVAEILPCIICKIHMKRYIQQHAITEPVSSWLHSFHNDVNERLGKPLVTEHHPDVDSRDALMRFLFAAGFVLDDHCAKERTVFMEFLVHACASVGITVKKHNAPMSLPRFLFDFFTTRGDYSASFHTLVNEYVPTGLHHIYLLPYDDTAAAAPAPAPAIITITAITLCLITLVVIMRKSR